MDIVRCRVKSIDTVHCFMLIMLFTY